MASAMYFPLPATTLRRNAARVVADVYQDHIRDGNVWEVADDIISKYFDEFIDHKIAEKMVRYTARIFVNMD